MRHHVKKCSLIGLLFGLTLWSWTGTAWAQGLNFHFVSASMNNWQGDHALDHRLNTAWSCFSHHQPAWYLVRLDEPTWLSGVMVATAKMPASSSYRIEVSSDDQHFQPILEHLRNVDDGPILRAFPSPQKVAYLRVSFENHSDLPYAYFALREIVPVPLRRLIGGIPGTPSVPAHETARLLGAVIGSYEGQRVIVLVGAHLSGPISSVKVEGHALTVLDRRPTQLLCAYPYDQVPDMTLQVDVGGQHLQRLVAIVDREIIWPPPSP